MKHDDFILQAIACANQARINGDHPFGAVLVHDGKVILKCVNTVVTDSDATQHAELRLVSNASRIFSKQVLTAAVLYASTEPCAMCAGAIYWTGIRKVVFGLPARELGAMTRGSLVIPCEQVFCHGREGVEVIGPLRLQESSEVHRGFWLS